MTATDLTKSENESHPEFTGYFFRVPDETGILVTLSFSALKCFLALFWGAQRVRSYGGSMTPQQIAENSGLTPPRVRATMPELSEAGLVAACAGQFGPAYSVPTNWRTTGDGTRALHQSGSCNVVLSGFWFRFPVELELLLRLTHVQLKVFLVVERSIQRDRHPGLLSRRQVAARANTGLRHAQTAIRHLSKLGCIRECELEDGSRVFRSAVSWQGPRESRQSQAQEVPTDRPVLPAGGIFAGSRSGGPSEKHRENAWVSSTTQVGMGRGAPNHNTARNEFDADYRWVHESIEKFFVTQSIRKPRGPLPAREIADELLSAGMKIEDLDDFWPEYAFRLTSPPQSWNHLSASLRNWIAERTA